MAYWVLYDGEKDSMNTYEIYYVVKNTYMKEIKAKTYDEALKNWESLSDTDLTTCSEPLFSAYTDMDAYIFDAIEISDDGKRRNVYLRNYEEGAA